jgi:YidC/Oxa1 family membrane protein insertase
LRCTARFAEVRSPPVALPAVIRGIPAVSIPCRRFALRHTMDNYRLILLLALGLIVMMIWQAWEQEHATAPPAAQATPDARPGPPTAVAPPASPQAATTAPSPVGLKRGTRVVVTTDLVRAEIDTEGGDLRDLWLLHHPVSVDRPDQPFALFKESEKQLFVAQSGLIGHGREYPNDKVRYTAEHERYSLESGSDEVRVPLAWRGPDGVRYTKTFVFRRGSYVIDVEYLIDNRTANEWTGFFYGQFLHSHVDEPGIFSLPTYTGGAIYTPDKKYQKISFADMAKRLNLESVDGWVALLQHYFVGAWIQEPDKRTQFYSDGLPSQWYVIGTKDLTPTVVAPGQKGTVHARLYAGPKDQERLEQIAPGLELTVDYGLLTLISAPLFWLLSLIHRWVGNWGWSIIILTVLIKLAFYPLSAASYKSMAQMKKLQPKLQSLKERYGDDRQKLNQAMMEMYKTERINPLGGCLPILIQIPVFIALYWVLLESVEMRQAPFVLWIRDLSTPDPYFVLPIIMGVTMYAQQLLNPQPPDPVQRRIFLAMPVVFTAMFLFFPSGLVLYWVVNNVLSILQQWNINRVIVKKGS